MDAKHKTLRAVLKFVPFKNALRKFVFKFIYRSNFWRSKESISGIGSTMRETAALRKALPRIIKKYKIKSMVDAPCGDFLWISTLNLKIKYVGYDIVPEIIDEDRKRFKKSNITFHCADIVTSRLQKADLILCRDCLVHLSNKHVQKALDNFRASGAKYLMATTFPNIKVNEDIADGMWRRINLTRPPFNLQKPLLLVNERSQEDKNKSIGLWKL